MRTRTKTLLTLGLLATLAVPMVAAARRPLAGAPGAALGAAPGGLLERAAKRLDLTPEQKGQIRDIVAAHQGELEVELAAVKKTRGELWDAIHATSPDDATIRAAATAVGRAEGELGVTRAAMVQEVRAVLTPEQQAELTQMLGDARALAQTFFERIKSRVDAFLAG